MLRGIKDLKTASTGCYARRDDAWWFGKLTQRHIPNKNAIGRKPTRPGSDIYTDIVGPFPVPTREGHVYFVVYKCGYTQHVAIYLLKRKLDLLDTWKRYIADMRNFAGATKDTTIAPGTLHYPEDPQFCISDDEQVYVEGDFRKFNTDHMVGQWAIAPYTHSANPAESTVRRIVEAGIAALYRSGLPPSFILYACMHAVGGMNRTYTPIHHCEEHRLQTPQQRRLKYVPHIDEVPPFGCLAMVHVHKDNRGKGGPHAWKGFYTGPINNMNGYRIFRPLNNATYDRYHVVFDATVFYGDFMGQQFQDRVRADQLQRSYFNQEIDTLLGITPGKNPLLDLLTQPSWQRLPMPADASAQPVPAAAAAAPAQPAPPAHLRLVNDPLAVDQAAPTAPVQAVARLQEAIQAEVTPPP